MAKPSKLNLVWADGGVSVDPGPSKWDLGWIAEIPPYQNFNYIFNKFSSALKNLNQWGILEWDALTTYLLGSRVMHSGVIYKCTVATSTGPVPGVSANWLNPDISFLPVGFVYTQYPGKNSPADMGWFGTWTNISSEFAGDFFRAEGGAASAFESGEQNFRTKLKSHTHAFSNSPHNHAPAAYKLLDQVDPNLYGLVRGRTLGSTQPIDTDTISVSGVVGAASNTGDAETAPVNRTIILWERTA